MNLKNSLLLLCIICFFFTLSDGESKKKKERSGPTKAELKRTDKAVENKVRQLFKVIESMQAELQAVNDGNDRNIEVMLDDTKRKYEKFSSTISKLGKQNSDLYKENKKLRQEKNILIDKISALEEQLIEQAREARNAGAEVWLRKTAEDLRDFLHDSGLEHFASPKFSPIVAGIVANGAVTLPLAMTSVYLIRYMKQLTIIRVLLAFNLFDAGLASTVILSSILLLGDPLEGMRHISEVNFVFVQLVIAGVFWISMGLIVAGIAQNRKGKAWRFLGIQFVLKIIISLDYIKRVWVPTMERNDVPLGTNVIAYGLYLISAAAEVWLTTVATRRATIEIRQNATSNSSTVNNENGSDEVMVTLVTQHTD